MDGGNLAFSEYCISQGIGFARWCKIFLHPQICETQSYAFKCEPPGSTFRVQVLDFGFGV